MVAALELDIFRILRELESIVERSRFDIREITSPSTGILKRLRASIPDDIARAQQILQERAQIIGDAQSEASLLLRRDSVIHEAQRVVQETLARAQTELDRATEKRQEAEAFLVEVQERDSQSRELAQKILELSKALEDLKPAWGTLGYLRRDLRRFLNAPS